ncbi:hypothetical protein WQ53_08920 [Pseudoxanthomonas suwonensis]|uniref:Uncharacterized protein n=1 Tax=Pseudoxanthomonas suwonensis TaxID=314722 RepID=A0A0E3Z104_9GAMM|nr:hypothetical protein WQ53_08920 [Pseudoxanthomonas suwonensis]
MPPGRCPVGLPACSITLRGSEYFDDTFREPEAYLVWQDTIWRTLHSTGRVQAGDPRALPPAG